MVIARSCCSKADLDFQGKHSGEHFQFQFHQHWIRLVWPAVKLLLWNFIILGLGYSVFVMTYISDAWTRRAILILLTLFFVMSQLEFLVKIYRYLLYIVVITDKKLHRIKKTLLMTDDHLSVDLWMAQDIHKCQSGILQNVLGYGSVIVEAQESITRLHFVPRVSKKYEKMLFLREQARAKMGYIGGEKQKKAPKK
jgi:hypothetical protein